MCVYFAAIAIEFDQLNYEVTEGKSVEICVVLMGETDSSVEVTLSSQSGTASGWTFHTNFDLFYASSPLQIMITQVCL